MHSNFDIVADINLFI